MNASWKKFTYEIITNASFNHYDLNNVSDLILKQVEKYVQMPNFYYSARISRVIEAVGEWVVAVYNFSVEKNRVRKNRSRIGERIYI